MPGPGDLPEPAPIEEAGPSDETDLECPDCEGLLILEGDPHSDGMVLVCPACLQRVAEVPEEPEERGPPPGLSRRDGRGKGKGPGNNPGRN